MKKLISWFLGLFKMPTEEEIAEAEAWEEYEKLERNGGYWE